jgi:hypothetical protein
MKVLARIPLVQTAAGPEGPARVGDHPATIGKADVRPATAVEAGRRPQRRSFPAGSTTVLATLAALAWMLAAWNDSLRLARSHRPDRLASQPPATAPLTTIKP